MKRVFIFIVSLSLLLNVGLIYSQFPMAFKYQAIIRNNAGQALVNKVVGISVKLHQGSTMGIVVYSEVQNPTTSNDGLINLNIGEGTDTTGNFAGIDWSAGPYFLEIGLDAAGGTNFTSMGTSQLLSVPYALYSQKTHSADQLVVQANSSIPSDSALFVVNDKNGQPVFAVYETGVEITYDVNPLSKGAKGGFSVGGRSPGKGPLQNIANMNTDSVRIYIDTTKFKGAKGGFSVGGRSSSKGSSDDYFAITNSSSAEIVNPSKPTILWYPSKSAFLAGQVLIESPDSVGLYSIAVGDSAKAIGYNSQSFGYRTEATGNYSSAIGNLTQASGSNSQAFGYNTFAKGNYSAAFGNYSQALSDNSFAIGYGAIAVNSNAYAFGSHSIASGYGSFAMGGQGNFSGNLVSTEASGDHSFAFGIGSKAFNTSDIAIGYGDTASGGSSLAIGAYNLASGFSSIAMGFQAKATAGISVSFGYQTQANGSFSLANGVQCQANGYASSALGYRNQANYYYCTALGFLTVADSGEAAFASGYETQSLNNGSVSMGWFSRSTGPYAFAGGFATFSTGMASLAFGMQTIARGMGATALGRFSTANGDNSLALGSSTAKSYASLTLGMYNDTTSTSSTSWVATDPILSIGNGFSGGTHNAFTVLKNGYTAIGHSAPSQMLDVNGNARFRAVGSGTGVSALYIDANGVLTTSTSDESMKHNFIHITGALEKVMELNGLYYSWKSDVQNTRRLGFIAQDMEKIIPEAVFTNPTDGLKGINYAELTAVLAEAIKEQQNIIETQQQEINRLKGLEARIAQLEQILDVKK
jgi:Chaperone of endosialidase/Head domain of trimeric autotransporter adhesin